MSELTIHGEHVADQIQESDAYGSEEELTLADVWYIVDNLHSHFLDTNRDTKIFSKWMRELEDLDEDLPL